MLFSNVFPDIHLVDGDHHVGASCFVDQVTESNQLAATEVLDQGREVYIL
jgi:hypothetical protein